MASCCRPSPLASAATTATTTRLRLLHAPHDALARGAVERRCRHPRPAQREASVVDSAEVRGAKRRERVARQVAPGEESLLERVEDRLRRRREGSTDSLSLSSQNKQPHARHHSSEEANDNDRRLPRARRCCLTKVADSRRSPE